jgi:hypothetical protein
MSAVLDSLNTELAPQTNAAVMPGFNSQGGWELANRIGKAFAASSLVPAQYQNNVANCIVALEMANRMGASPLMVMQNLYIVHGNPGWSSKFLIACFNQSGKFSALRYEWNKDRTGCRAAAVELSTGERLIGPEVTMQMAKDEGWAGKNGSKWKTMPELMLMYRAAAFFVRTYAPEISMGLSTAEEIGDVIDAPTRFVAANEQNDVVAKAAAAFKARQAAPEQPQSAPQAQAETTPQQEQKKAPKVTFANVMDSMNKAKNLDALFTAADLISEVEDLGQQNELAAKFEELKGKF